MAGNLVSWVEESDLRAGLGRTWQLTGGMPVKHWRGAGDPCVWQEGPSMNNEQGLFQGTQCSKEACSGPRVAGN